MKKNQTTIFVAVCVFCFIFYRCTTDTQPGDSPGDSAISNTNTYGGYGSQAEWGKHLVSTMGCGDCHTPKKMTDRGPADDSSLLLSGSPSAGMAPLLLPEQVAKGMAATNDLTSWTGPWGTTFAANLTPDSTGLGSWTEQQFITCIREGRTKGLSSARPLLPPMPYASFRNLTDEELKAIFAFLKSIKQISNAVPAYKAPAGPSR